MTDARKSRRITRPPHRLTRPMQLVHPDLALHLASLDTLLLHIQYRLVEVLLWRTECTRDRKCAGDIGRIVTVLAPGVNQDQLAGAKLTVVVDVVNYESIGAGGANKMSATTTSSPAMTSLTRKQRPEHMLASPHLPSHTRTRNVQPIAPPFEPPLRIS